MLNNLCAACGAPLGTVDGRAFHAFPSLQALCELKEEQLRSMGFGYRHVAAAVLYLASNYNSTNGCDLCMT
jgi:3-methyladenine DNA glycosylase/8-oxoguanine DNA glycosylase